MIQGARLDCLIADSSPLSGNLVNCVKELSRCNFARDEDKLARHDEATTCASINFGDESCMIVLNLAKDPVMQIRLIIYLWQIRQAGFSLNYIYLEIAFE